MNIFEKYGRLADQFQAEQERHADTVQVVADLKTGRLRLDQVDVSFVQNADGSTSTNWATFPDRQPPAPPAPPSLTIAPQSEEQPDANAAPVVDPVIKT